MNEGKLGAKVVLGYMKAAGGYCLSFLVFLVFLLSIASQNSATVFLSYWLGQGSGVSPFVEKTRIYRCGVRELGGYVWVCVCGCAWD